ncbi:MAG: hypothetical protein EOO73_20805 [Myxococcales bacterium]|nr:MAG: hypothetical protein EOO73_20805 [Myxococcales bacterium]
MNLKLTGLGLCVAACLAGALTTSEPARAESAPAASSKAELQRALQDAVTRHVARSGVGSSLRGYALAPAIVQLRRYAEPNGKQSKTVCIVSLAVKNQREELVAEVRGSAAALGGSQLDAVDAAASSAVSRVPEVLSKLQGDQTDRVARR